MEDRTSNDQRLLALAKLTQMNVILMADNFQPWNEDLGLIIWGQDPEVVAAVYGGEDLETETEPQLDDTFNVLTDMGERIRKYEKTQAGLRLLELDTIRFEQRSKTKRDLLAKIAKIMWAAISPASKLKLELEGRGTMTFDKTDDMLKINVAKRHPGVMMSLIEKTHYKSNDRDLVRLVKLIMNLKQTQTVGLTQYINEHCKAKDEIQRSIFGLNGDKEVNGFEVLDAICKAMVLCQVDQTSNLAPLNELASQAAVNDKACTHDKVIDSLLAYNRQIDGRKEITTTAADKKAYKAMVIDKQEVESTCTDCGTVFAYRISAENGKVFQRCGPCHRKVFELRKAKGVDTKHNPNLNRAELIRLLKETDAKSAAKVDVPTKKGVAKAVIPQKGVLVQKLPVLPQIKAAMLEIEEETDAGEEYEDEEDYYY